MIFDIFFTKFMSSIPLIVISLIIDMVLFTKRKNYLNISVIKSIMKSKILISTALLLILINLTFIGIYSIIINDKVLDVYPTNTQIIINTILITFPAINLGGLWFLLYSVKYKEALDMRLERDNVIREKSVIMERSRLARDVHDTLGHSLTLIIKLLEVCKIAPNNDIVNDQLEEAIKIAQEGVQGVKLSISGILDEKILNKDLISSLTILADEFEKNSGISVDVSTQGTVEEINKENAIVLYSVCQELDKSLLMES